MPGTNPACPAGSSARVATCSGFSFKVAPLLNNHRLSLPKCRKTNETTLTFRCVLQCQDEVKDKVSLKNFAKYLFFGPTTQFLKVGPNTPESEMRKFRGEFETCAIACCDKWLLKLQMLMFDCRSHFPATFLQLSLPRSIAKMPNLLIKLKEAFESGKL